VIQDVLCSNQGAYLHSFLQLPLLDLCFPQVFTLIMLNVAIRAEIQEGNKNR
jgi:hypothetical protein